MRIITVMLLLSPHLYRINNPWYLATASSFLDQCDSVQPWRGIWKDLSKIKFLFYIIISYFHIIFGIYLIF